MTHLCQSIEFFYITRQTTTMTLKGEQVNFGIDVTSATHAGWAENVSFNVIDGYNCLPCMPIIGRAYFATVRDSKKQSIIHTPQRTSLLIIVFSPFAGQPCVIKQKAWTRESYTPAQRSGSVTRVIEGLRDCSVAKVVTPSRTAPEVGCRLLTVFVNASLNVVKEANHVCSKLI